MFSNATGDVQLTTAWGVNAAYDHLWQPNFRTSVYAAYTRYEYGNNANLAICNAQSTGFAGASTSTLNFVSAAPGGGSGAAKGASGRAAQHN